MYLSVGLCIAVNNFEMAYEYLVYIILLGENSE